MTFSFHASGSFKQTESWLRRLTGRSLFQSLDKYGQRGVEALRSATPVDSGATASSWGYRVIKDVRRPGIEWFNSNTVNGTPVAVLIQYGHGTGTGGYVSGRDYINPAVRPIFDQIAEDIWRQVRA